MSGSAGSLPRQFSVFHRSSFLLAVRQNQFFRVLLSCSNFSSSSIPPSLSSYIAILFAGLAGHYRHRHDGQGTFHWSPDDGVSLTLFL